MSETSDVEGIDPRTVEMVAALTIDAALAMTGDDYELQVPTFGWMIPPATGAPEVEMGAALAVHAIMRTHGLSRADLEAVSAQLKQHVTE